jgi:hypothetical protein
MYMPQFCHFSTVDEEGQSKKLSLPAKLLHTNSHYPRVYCWIEDAQSAMPTREVPLLLLCLTFELKNKSKPDIKTISGSVVTNLMVSSFHQLHSVTTSALK